MYICIYRYVHIYICMYVHTCIQTCIHVCRYQQIYMYTLYMHKSKFNTNMNTHLKMHLHINIYTYVHVYTNLGNYTEARYSTSNRAQVQVYSRPWHDRSAGAQRRRYLVTRRVPPIRGAPKSPKQVLFIYFRAQSRYYLYTWNFGEC